jgi:hypothetical protein
MAYMRANDGTTVELTDLAQRIARALPPISPLLRTEIVRPLRRKLAFTRRLSQEVETPKRRGVRISLLSFLHTVQHAIVYGYFCLMQRRGERVS